MREVAIVPALKRWAMIRERNVGSAWGDGVLAKHGSFDADESP